MLEDSIRSKGYRDVIAKGRAQGLVVIGLTLDETGAPLKRDMRSSLVLQMMEMDPARPGRSRPTQFLDICKGNISHNLGGESSALGRTFALGGRPAPIENKGINPLKQPTR
jgi:hypothetical protein